MVVIFMSCLLCGSSFIGFMLSIGIYFSDDAFFHILYYMILFCVLSYLLPQALSFLKMIKQNIAVDIPTCCSPLLAGFVNW